MMRRAQDGLVEEIVSLAQDAGVLLRNPFRVLQLSVWATLRDVGRRARSVESAVAVGLPPDPGPCPWLPLGGVDADAIQGARRALSSTLARVVCEFFWFWPLERDGGADAGLEALARGDLEGAESAWHSVAASGDGPQASTATHNLAVLVQIQALDSDPGTPPSLAAYRAGRRSRWPDVPGLWQNAMDDAGLWRIVRDRIAVLGDPAVPPDAEASVRQAVPLAVATLAVSLALRATARGYVRYGDALARMVGSWSAHMPPSYESPLQRGSRELRGAILTRCELLARACEADPNDGLAQALQLSQEMRPDLNALDLVLGRESPQRNEVFDAYARALFRALAATGTVRAPSAAHASLCSAALACAVDDELRQELQAWRGWILRTSPATPPSQPDSDNCFSMVGLDVYAANPFRVSELPVDADAALLARRKEQVDTSRASGTQVPDGPQPWMPVPDGREPQAVAQALGVLQDAAARNVWTLFWYWPQIGDPLVPDAALQGGSPSALADAVALWSEQARVLFDPLVPLHNLTLNAHMAALTERHADADAEARAWGAAYTRWVELLGAQSFNLWLAAHWLGSSTAALNTALRRHLLSMNVSLAMTAARNGNAQRAVQHIGVVERSGFPVQDIRHALRPAAGLMTAALGECHAAAQAQCANDASQGLGIAASLLDRCATLLSVLAELGPRDHATLREWRDSTALTACACVDAFAAHSGAWTDCGPMLERCLAVAASAKAQRAIQRSLLRVSSEEGAPRRQAAIEAKQSGAEASRPPADKAAPRGAPPEPAADKVAEPQTRRRVIVGSTAFGAGLVILCVLAGLVLQRDPARPPLTPVPTRTRPIVASTAQASGSPRATSTLLPTDCDPRIADVVDVNVPDGTVMRPGEEFTKTWSVKNASGCPWGNDVALRRTDDVLPGAPDQVSLPATDSGAVAEISVTLHAPDAPGTYHSVWGICRAGQDTEDCTKIWVEILVSDGQP